MIIYGQNGLMYSAWASLCRALRRPLQWAPSGFPPGYQLSGAAFGNPVLPISRRALWGKGMYRNHLQNGQQPKLYLLCPLSALPGI